MLVLARPYQDELISSALVRGCRHFNMAMKQLLDLGGNGEGKGNGMTLFGVSPLPYFASLFDMEAQTLLARHTVLPFATAFATHDVWTRAVDSALSGASRSQAMGAVIQSAIHGLPSRRFCRGCVADDLRTLGESYWRLPHQLPGSLVCHRHGEALRSTALRIAGVNSSYDLPEDCTGRPCISGPVSELWRRLAVRTAELSRRQLEPPEDRAGTYYRDLAVARDWLRLDRDADGNRVRQLFVDRFGKPELTACGLLPSARTSWVSLMLQASPGTPFATLKHVLMDEFLSGPSVDVSHKPTGPSARARLGVDKDYATAVRSVVAGYAGGGRRTRVADVLRQAGCWNAYRHARVGTLPKLSRLVKKLQSSELAYRPQALQVLSVPGAEGSVATRQDLIKAGHLLFSKEAAKRLGVHWTEMKQLQRDGLILSIRYAARDWYPAFWCEAGADREMLEAHLGSVRGLAAEEQWASLVKSLAPRPGTS